jgi:hypothetical protein
MENKTDSTSKNIRGRFVIQEIIEPKVDEEEEIEDIYQPQSSQSQINLTNIPIKHTISRIISKELFRKRRNSFNNSKFKLNSKNNLENDNNNKFYVYDFFHKKYVDINIVFKKYNDQFEFHKNLFKRNSNKKRSIHFTQFYQKIEKKQTSTQLNLPIVQKDYKKVEKFNIFHRSYSINSEKDKHVSIDTTILSLENTSKNSSNLNIKPINTTYFQKKKLFPQFQRIMSINNKSDLLVEERVLSLIIESQNFKECTIKECQFTM